MLDNALFMNVFGGKHIDVVGGLDVCKAVDEVAQQCQDGVPYSGSQRGIKQKWPQLHACQSCRNADELAHGRDEPAEESGRDRI